jgi:hypothetical protein
MCDKTLNIIYNKEKRLLINAIKNIGLSREGTIFGGLVRDEIIATYYRNEFIQKKLNFSNYWDLNYSQDTIGRLIIPNDIDIYFKTNENIKEFIKDIESYINSFHSYINITEVVNPRFNYHINFDIIHTKVFIGIKLGKTISFSGITIKLNIDIIGNKNNSLDNIEPPFYNVDFLSNIFIMQKNNGIINIRPSNCTGTLLDEMNFTKKTINVAKIVQDMIKFNTQFCRNTSNTFDTEYVNCYRIIKMLNKDISWNITNLPFAYITINEENNDDKCCICLENIKKEQLLISINNKNILHKKCFISYLNMEQHKKYRNSENIIEIRCPFRTPFNFKDCYLNINYI